MQAINVNWLAVLVAAVSNMIIGGLWYGPIFGKKWQALMGWSHSTPEQMAAMKKGMGKSYFIMFIAALVMAYVFAHTISYAGAKTLMDAIAVAFWTWLGFIGTVTLSSVLWEKKPKALWVLNNGYWLVSLIVMAKILVMWK